VREPDSLGKLMTRMKSQNNGLDIRRRVRLERLFDHPEKISLKEVEGCFGHKDWGVRSNALVLLSFLDSDESIRLIVSSFRDIDWAVQESAAYSVVKIGAKAMPILQEMISRETNLARESVWANRAMKLINMGDTLVLDLNCRRDIHQLMWTVTVKTDGSQNNTAEC